MLSQVLKLNAPLLSQCHDKLANSKCATTYKCKVSSCSDLLEIIEGLQNIWVEACYGFIMSYKSIFSVEQIHLKCI
jgi:hypothetical protein